MLYLERLGKAVRHWHTSSRRRHVSEFECLAIHPRAATYSGMHLLGSLYTCSCKSTVTPRRLHPLLFTLVVNSAGESKCLRRSRYTAAQANFLLSDQIVALKEGTYWPARTTKMSSWRKNTTRNNTVPVDSNAFQGQDLQTSRSKNRWGFRKSGLLIPELERDGERVILLWSAQPSTMTMDPM